MRLLEGLWGWKLEEVGRSEFEEIGRDGLDVSGLLVLNGVMVDWFLWIDLVWLDLFCLSR